MTNWNPDVYEILKEAGWYEAREIDTIEIVQLLEDRGFKVTEQIINFIKNFGMLSITVYTEYSAEIIEKYHVNPYSRHSTDVYQAIGDTGDYYCTTIFEDFIEDKLTIVGKISNLHLWLMISESGKFYCDEGKLGDTVEEAWECILTNKRQLIPWSKLD